MALFKSTVKSHYLKQVTEQVEKNLRELEKEGLDISLIRIKRYQKTHYKSCKCSLCSQAEKKDNPYLRGILEIGFKVYVNPSDSSE